jgi:subtilase-type serine protease
MLGWRHAFGDTVPTSSFAFAGSHAFTVAGAPIARNAAIIEAGLDFDITPQATLGISYTGQIASTARDHGINADLRVRF